MFLDAQSGHHLPKARSWLRSILYYVGGLLVADVLALVAYWWLPSPESVILPFVLLVMSWLLTALLQWSARRAPRRRVFSAHPHGTGSASNSSLLMAMPPAQAREAVEQAAATLPGARLVRRRDTQVVFRVPGSWGRFYGQLVGIDISGQQAGTRVRVFSRPVVAPAVRDHGKNQANVDMVLSLLEEADQRYVSSRESPG